jgi:serine/threonine protein kinase
MAEESRTRIGRYEITAPLDAGGMGQVFRAWDPSLRRDVAVKLLRDEVAEDPARRQRLLEEARAAGSLNHPNIIAVYDVGTSEDVAFIVTELVDGTKLRQEVEGGRCLCGDSSTWRRRWRPASAWRTRPALPTATSSRTT